MVGKQQISNIKSALSLGKDSKGIDSFQAAYPKTAFLRGVDLFWRFLGH